MIMMMIVFQTDEKIIEELNKAIILDKYPVCVPLTMTTLLKLALFHEPAKRAKP